MTPEQTLKHIQRYIARQHVFPFLLITTMISGLPVVTMHLMRKRCV